MSGGERQKVIGACVIGLALVGAAYTISHFGQKTPLPASVGKFSAPTRNAITVSDKDENGVEDWRDAYVQAKPIILDKAATSSYTLPTTLTGKLGIEFFQSYVNSKNAGSFGKTDQELLGDTANEVAKQANDRLYDTKDVSVMSSWNDNDIKLYADTMAGILLSSKAPEHENEVLILRDIVTTGKTDRIQELTAIAEDYKMFREQSLKVPVPQIFVKEHLDLINAYNALQADISAMTLAFDDPLMALLRTKRYQDDALGLSLALQNMNDTLKPFGHLFGKDDPAVFFANFDPNNQTQKQ